MRPARGRLYARYAACRRRATAPPSPATSAHGPRRACWATLSRDDTVSRHSMPRGARQPKHDHPETARNTMDRRRRWAKLCHGGIVLALQVPHCALAHCRAPPWVSPTVSSGAGRAARRPAMPVIGVISAGSRHKYVKFPARVAATAHSRLWPKCEVPAECENVCCSG